MRLFVGSAFLVWTAAILAGFAWLYRYEHVTGAMPAAPTAWPAAAALAPNPHGATLLMFVHPECPCSRASLSELERLMARCQGQVDAQIVFVVAPEQSTDFAHTDLWETAGRIPGVRTVIDRDGALAERFGAATSGHVVVYDSAGQLLYRGGITGSRGHEGDNAGRLTIEDLLQAGIQPDAAAEQPVYGCPLIQAASDQAAGASR